MILIIVSILGIFTLNPLSELDFICNQLAI